MRRRPGVDDEDWRWIEEYEARRHDPRSLSKESLIRIAQAMSAYIDELTATQRSPGGEEVVQDDPVVGDDEEYVR